MHPSTERDEAERHHPETTSEPVETPADRSDDVLTDRDTAENGREDRPEDAEAASWSAERADHVDDDRHLDEAAHTGYTDDAGRTGYADDTGQTRRERTGASADLADVPVDRDGSEVAGLADRGDRTEVLVGRDHPEDAGLTPVPTPRPDGPGEELPTRLFADDDAEHFRARWTTVQGGFVDDPRGAVRQAGELVTELMQALTARLAERKEQLEGGSPRDGEDDTEALRQAVRRYRAFFDQLLRA